MNAIKFIMAILPLVLLPLSSQADTLQGEFDWSGPSRPVFFGPPSDISGTAYFVYDTASNQGTISGLPVGFGDTNGIYNFSTFYDLSGSYFAFPATSFADLTVYQHIIVNGEAANTTWIISPAPDPASLPGEGETPISLGYSGGDLSEGNIVLHPGTSPLPSSGDDVPPLFSGTYSNFIQEVPEPGTGVLLVLGCIGIPWALRRKRPTSP